jgi:hypothetical protein
MIYTNSNIERALKGLQETLEEDVQDGYISKLDKKYLNAIIGILQRLG